MEWVVSKAKDFIGKRSYARADTAAHGPQAPGRRAARRPHTCGFPEGTQLIGRHGPRSTPATRPVPMLGHVTSSYHSAALGRSFALALIKNGRNRIGETLLAPRSATSWSTSSSAKPSSTTPKGPRAMAEPTIDRRHRRVRGAAPQPGRAPGRADSRRRGHRRPGRPADAKWPFLTMVGVRVDPGSAAAARIETRLGAPLPTAVRTQPPATASSVLWLGPGRVLVVSPDEAAGPLAAELRRGARRTTRARWSTCRPTAPRSSSRGPSARAVLEKGCPLDLHPRAFAAGTAVVDARSARSRWCCGRSTRTSVPALARAPRSPTTWAAGCSTP